MKVNLVSKQVCIVGGGPAGMMLGYLVARAGVEVIVLEKHSDFFRDFRGDTVHPSTLEVFSQLGLLDAFLKRPHQKTSTIHAVIGGREVPIADFSMIKAKCQYIAMMPQWEFLDFLRVEASRYPNFNLMMDTELTDLIVEDSRVVGVRAESQSGSLEVRSTLVIGADGRHSKTRERAGLLAETIGAPIDVLWFRLSRRPDDPSPSFGYFDRGRILVTINRQDYWQCGFVIPKEGYQVVRSAGLLQFTDEIAAIAPLLRNRTTELTDWDKIKLLTVQVDRLISWSRPGLLCIGDSAHAMSPVGGVGINLAIQDAVAAANILVPKLKANTLSTADLRRVQKRRDLPTRLTQALQVFAHRRVISRVLSSTTPVSLPWPIRVIAKMKWLRRIPAFVIGIGFRPESPEKIFERDFTFQG